MWPSRAAIPAPRQGLEVGPTRLATTPARGSSRQRQRRDRLLLPAHDKPVPEVSPAGLDLLRPELTRQQAGVVDLKLALRAAVAVGAQRDKTHRPAWSGGPPGAGLERQREARQQRTADPAGAHRALAVGAGVEHPFAARTERFE